MVTYIDTDPKISSIIVPITASMFTGANQSILAGLQMQPSQRVLSVDFFKEVAFDAGTLQFGHGATSGLRNSLGSADEIAANTAGTAELNAWRTGTYGSVVGGWNGLLAAGARSIYVRSEGAVPTVGSGFLIIRMIHLSPRPTL